MCYALFIGSDTEIDTLSAEEAVDTEAFHLQPLDDRYRTILRHFSKPFVYYAASWQGCGCGWFRDAMLLRFKAKRREDNDRTAGDLRALAALLGELGTTELFLTWESELDEDVARSRELTPADFEVDSIPLLQGDFATVRVLGASDTGQTQTRSTGRRQRED